MSMWIVDLTVTPSMERSHLRGVIVHLELDESPTKVEARLWSRRHQRMDWLPEPPNVTSIRGGPHSTLDDEVARTMLVCLQQASLGLAPLGGLESIHPTQYRLEIHSWGQKVQLEWLQALPTEFADLAELVHLLELIGHKHATDD